MEIKNVLVTCMGGYGALNLVENIKLTGLKDELRFVGTHVDPYLLTRSTADKNYKVPYASREEEYIEQNKRIVKNENIDLFIPKSDKEVTVVSKYRDELGCKVFLPDDDEVQAAQDKLTFSDILTDSGVHVAKTMQITSFEGIDQQMAQIPSDSKYWIRVKTPGEMGAYGATWVETAHQAEVWIKLWMEMKDVKLEEFTISEFLPGRLFECSLFYSKGKMLVGKVYENVRYYGAEQRLSGMSSTPEIARTIADENAVAALDESKKAVEAIANHVGTKPNGVYHLSVKENMANQPCVTESNIGRFPSTCAFFDRTGKVKLGELYVRYGLGLENDSLNGEYDLVEEEIYMIRSLDKEISFKSKEEISSFPDAI